jgi:esterase/lipase
MKTRSKKSVVWTGIVLLVVIIYMLGPKPVNPVYTKELPTVASLDKIEQSLNYQEKRLPIKPGNAAQIVWANKPATETEYVVLYLHGFSACQEEGNPVHRDFAAKYGCNLLLSRLYDHGLNSKQPLGNLTPERLWQSALQYYAMARKLGKKVIVIGTSTGGTLALKLAAEFPDIYAVILYSPNIQINNRFAWILNNPWGLQIARIIQGSNEIVSDEKSDWYKKYWYDHYNINAAVQLQELTKTTMVNETFENIKQPVLLLYYYKDETQQDSVVKVSAMLKMFEHLGTPADKKMKAAIPEAGNHVICSSLRSKDVNSVERLTFQFAEQILHMTSK